MSATPSTTAGSLTTLLHVRSPQGKVVAEELHDEGRVFVGFLGEGIEFGNRIVKGLFGEVTGTVGAVQNLVAGR